MFRARKEAGICRAGVTLKTRSLGRMHLRMQTCEASSVEPYAYLVTLLKALRGRTQYRRRGPLAVAGGGFSD